MAEIGDCPKCGRRSLRTYEAEIKGNDTGISYGLQLVGRCYMKDCLYAEVLQGRSRGSTLIN